MQRGSQWSPVWPSIQMKPTSAMTTAATPRAISNRRQVARERATDYVRIDSRKPRQGAHGVPP